MANELAQDRTNIGNAKVAGMNDDLGVNSTQYFLAIVVFQIGYVIAEVPSKYAFQSLALDLLANTYAA
jgi:hypothetical protein